MTFDQLTLALPTHWLPACINGDTTGLDDNEARAFTRWETDMVMEFGPLTYADAAEQSHFARYHDAAEYGVLPCDCYDVTVMFATSA